MIFIVDRAGRVSRSQFIEKYMAVYIDANDLDFVFENFADISAAIHGIFKAFDGVQPARTGATAIDEFMRSVGASPDNTSSSDERFVYTYFELERIALRHLWKGAWLGSGLENR